MTTDNQVTLFSGMLAFPPVAGTEYYKDSALMLFSMGTTSERLLRELSNYKQKAGTNQILRRFFSNIFSTTCDSAGKSRKTQEQNRLLINTYICHSPSHYACFRESHALHIYWNPAMFCYYQCLSTGLLIVISQSALQS